ISRGVGEDRRRLEACSRYLERRQVGAGSGISAFARRRGDRMKRREFITLLGGAAAAWPLAARAQQRERMRRVGVLTADAEDDPGVKARLAAFQQGLDRLEWSVDRNVRIDYRFAANNPDQYQPLAKELIRLQPDVLLAYTTLVAAAFGRESRTIPIVFVNVSDPIGSGLVASLARPGGNLTGLLLYEEGITGKWLAMLKEIAPGLSRAALIVNPKRSPYDYFVSSTNPISCKEHHDGPPRGFAFG